MKPAVPMPATPTLDQLRGVRDKSQAIGSFLEWLQHEKYRVKVRYYDKQAAKRST